MIDVREKGARFERAFSNIMKDRFPGTSWRRSRQSEGALLSDVYCYDGSDLLQSYWWELTHSRKPNPHDKMEQAERDIGDRDFTPVVIWRKNSERAVHATMWIEDLCTLYSGESTHQTHRALVTLDLEDLIYLLWVAESNA